MVKLSSVFNVPLLELEINPKLCIGLDPMEI